jgi:hypothetical protein
VIGQEGGRECARVIDERDPEKQKGVGRCACTVDGPMRIHLHQEVRSDAPAYFPDSASARNCK